MHNVTITLRTDSRQSRVVQTGTAADLRLKRNDADCVVWESDGKEPGPLLTGRDTTEGHADDTRRHLLALRVLIQLTRLQHIQQFTNLASTNRLLSPTWYTPWLWPRYAIGQTIICLPYGFYLLLSFFLLLFPRLISAVGYWKFTNKPHFHTWCGLSANLECMCEMCCTRLAANTGRKKSPFWHHCTTLSGCIFAAEACIDNWKKTC